MLHSENRQGGAQSHRPLTFIATFLFLIATTACGQGQPLSQEEIAAQQRSYIFDASAQDARRQLGHLLSVPSGEGLDVDTLVRNYYAGGEPWVWMNGDRLLPQADSLVTYLRQQVPSLGYNPEVFLIDSLAKDLVALDTLLTDTTNRPSALMARLELNLSKALVRYAAGQHFGFTNPHRIFNRIDRGGSEPGGYRRIFDIDLRRPDSAFVARSLAQVNAGTLLSYVNSLEPADSAYRVLRDSLLADTTGARRDLLLCNMERLRWRPELTADSSDRHIFVNIAAQQLWAVGPDSIQQMRICCGAPGTKTPLLHSKIHHVEVNPEWGIPVSIIRNEVSAHAGDSSYFARHGYYVTDGRTGQRVNPGSLSRDQMRTGRYSVRQYSGAGNSLGRLIFRFKNQFSVYLHDTNNRSAFSRDRRTISHGCVRVQHPFDLTRFVLPGADDQALDQIRLSIDYRPETEWGKEYKRQHPGAIRLVNNKDVAPQVPVFIEYYTLLPNPKTGKMEKWGDPYSFDQPLLKAIKPFMP